MNKVVLVLAGLLLCGIAEAGPEVIDQERLADAIYKAENSKRYPYGIKSINTHGDKVLARKICLTTINNNLARWQWARQQGDKRGFIAFLGARFCPIGAKDDPRGLNGHWVGNVTRLYHQALGL